MKKILLVAAMAVAFAAPPAMAADPATGSADDTNMIVKCTILPLLPECIEFWTAKAEEAAAKAEEVGASIADALS
jgi:hypothetical protein